MGEESHTPTPRLIDLRRYTAGMTITRRIAVLLAGTAMLLMGGLAAPAAAAPTPAFQGPTADEVARASAAKPGSCGDSLLCLYNNANYQGSRQDQYARANGTCDGVLYNDQVSSIWNGSGKSVRFYNDAGCTGQAFSLANGVGSAYMTITHPTQADELTSFKWGA